MLICFSPISVSIIANRTSYERENVSSMFPISEALVIALFLFILSSLLWYNRKPIQEYVETIEASYRSPIHKKIESARPLVKKVVLLLVLYLFVVDLLKYYLINMPGPDAQLIVSTECSDVMVCYIID